MEEIIQRQEQRQDSVSSTCLVYVLPKQALVNHGTQHHPLSPHGRTWEKFHLATYKSTYIKQRSADRVVKSVFEP